MHCWQVQFYGKVQGVWFRRFVETTANTLGIKGWVKNEPDGSVTAVIEHEDESLLEDLVFRCSKGPEHARVDHIEVTHMEPAGFALFEIRR